MFRIRPALDTDHDQVITLLRRLQAVPCHHIGYHGESEAELADELATLAWPANTFLAVDDADQVRGVLTADVDQPLGRAWWYGPFVDVPADHPAADRIWSRTADALYAAAHTQSALRGITDSELYGHVEHSRLAAFARRHGFPTGEYSSVLALDGVDLVRLVGAVPDRPEAAEIGEFPTPPTDSTIAAALIRLHEQSFPNTYLSAAAILADTGERVLVTATDGGKLVGYAVGGIQPMDYLIDFVAVSTESRCRGIGAALVTTLVQRLADKHGARPAACAVVAGGNAPSRRMLHTLGFRPRLELVSYRLRATSQVA
ncbi:MAG TPA: GNAT family N-acetyltransferase [Pseudonocardiaceae bacterium]|nr:GNAT family N-acetyltransferase [Pseudonocardiaceae bacterium]